jgi:predicted amidophosphoribosyltransferase
MLMKLQLLHLFEEKCQNCHKRLTFGDISPHDKRCSSCRRKLEKKHDRKDAEEQNTADRLTAADGNLLNVSQQMPDRGHDQKRGTAGWLMGEPSPGRSF